MLQNHWPEVVKSELHQMESELGDDWIDGGYFDAVDSPWSFKPEDTWPGIYQSANLIHQLYHLYKWQQTTGRNIAGLGGIVEFGAGYGALALVANRLGFDGEYFIVDLPEFALLQQFFLSRTARRHPDPDDHRGFYWVGMDWPGYLTDSGYDLAIAGYSLSEVDYGLRDWFFGSFPAKSYLLWYSNRFEEYDNLDYFQRYLPGTMPDIHWRHWRATHMPPETWYSIGWKQ